MATIYRCDRCSKDFSKDLTMVGTQNRSDWSEPHFTKIADLCFKCLEKFKDWVKVGEVRCSLGKE